MKRLVLLVTLAASICLCACADNGKGAQKTTGAVNDTSAPAVQQSTAAETTGSQDTVPKEENMDSLYRIYEDEFPIGVALPDKVFFEWGKYGELVTENFNSFTCENEMKPDNLLDRDATVADVKANYTSPKVKFDAPARLVKEAIACGAKVRLHTLVWHSQTPAWFFTEDYTAGGRLVSREVMLARMESYIASVLTYYKENYPGLIYAVDVVNEAFDPGVGDENGVRRKDNKWYDTIGPDYVYWAFYYARKYAADDMKLFYNDYSCMYKVDVILNNLAKAKEEGLIDGIGMQSHLDIKTSIPGFIDAMKRFCEAGYEVQMTELDIGVPEPTESYFKTQGNFYLRLMKEVVSLRRSGMKITGVTVWGLSDALTWRPKDYPLLFTEGLEPKPAYSGMMKAAK